MRERDVERYLVQRIRALGGECRKMTFAGHRGAPDRLVLLPGRLCWVELKQPKGAVALHQEREHAKLRKFGQQVHVLWTKGDVDNFILRLGGIRRVA